MAGTPTPVFGWPLPALTDPPDGPGQMSALALAIEATVNAPRASVEQSIAQSIPHNTWERMQFDIENYDTAAMHSTSTQNQRFTITKAGTYLFTGGLYISSNATGRRGVAWWVNGTQTRNCPVMVLPVGTTTIGVPAPSVMLKLALNDYVEMAVFQDSTAALLTAASAGNRSWATALYVGP